MCYHPYPSSPFWEANTVVLSSIPIVPPSWIIQLCYCPYLPRPRPGQWLLTSKPSYPKSASSCNDSVIIQTSFPGQASGCYCPVIIHTQARTVCTVTVIVHTSFPIIIQCPGLGEEAMYILDGNRISTATVKLLFQVCNHFILQW